MAKWILSENDADIELMSTVLNISPITSYVLANRNIRSKNIALRFLKPKLEYLEEIDFMKDVSKAIDIICEAKDQNKKIVVYGDYDVDGIMSTTILLKSLKKIGCNVDFYIPHREKEGYGLNSLAVKKLKDYDVLITCDNGISAIDEIKEAKAQGQKVIVIDHHEPTFEIIDNKKIDIIPVADAIINTKQKDCDYHFKYYCAAGVCYRFVSRLYKELDIEFDFNKELLIFAMIATFCDIVDLVGENRIIAKNGLAYINHKIKNIGLLALIKEKNINDKILDSFDIGFVIGPCINASGRLFEASLAVDLFTTSDYEKAEQLAKTLSELNEQRKKITNESVERLVTKVIKDKKEIEPVIVIYDKEIHESIAGIVAGRIKEIFFHPTIVLTKGKDYIKGSARSIEGYNIFESLFSNQDLFVKFGGHSMAAGLSLKEENIILLKERLNKTCNLKEEDFTETIYIEKFLELSEVSFPLVRELRMLEPFGKENKQPLFYTTNLKLDSIRIIENKNTIIMNVSDADKSIKAICFGKVEYFKQQINSLYDETTCDSILKGDTRGMYIDLVYSVDINEFNGNVSLQLKIKDFKLNKS